VFRVLEHGQSQRRHGSCEKRDDLIDLSHLVYVRPVLGKEPEYILYSAGKR